MKLYHGTTLENAKKIVKDGWNPSNKVWNVSMPNEVYFYAAEAYLESIGGEDLKEVVSQCFEQAKICAGTQSYRGERLVVLEVQIDEESVEEDYSCDGMAESGARTVHVDYLNTESEITKIWYSDSYVPTAGLFYVAFSSGNGVRINDSNLSEGELRMLEDIQNNCQSIFLDEMYETQILGELDLKTLEVKE